MSQSILNIAISKVTKAVELDRAGKITLAYRLYTDACDAFMKALKNEKNPDTKRLIRLKLTEYLERAEQLKSIIDSTTSTTETTNQQFPQTTAPSISQPPPPPQPQPQQQPTYYGELIRQTLSVNEIILDCKKRGIKFTDPLFPASKESLFKGYPPSKEAEELANNIIWKRASSNGAVLSRNNVNPQDVVQGCLGDCWLLGALSLIATKPERISEIIPFFSIEQGVFVVRFFRNRTKVDVVVDDLLPCSLSNGEPVFAHNRGYNEFWVSIVEKAMAKMCGSYYSLESGNESDALVDFTGGVAFTLLLKEQQVPLDTLWKLLNAYQEKGYLMGCANNRNQEEMGIVPNHAYGMLGMYEILNSTTFLIRVRNPWGEKEWYGPWADGTAQWDSVSQQEKARISYNPDTQDGTFFMVLQDFVNYFDKIYLCKTLPSDWISITIDGSWELGKSTGGCTNCITWMWNPQYYLNVTRKTQAFIVLSQGDVRKFGSGGGHKSTGYENSIGFTVLSISKTSENNSNTNNNNNNSNSVLRVISITDENVAVIERLPYGSIRERAVAITFEPSFNPYVIVPAIFTPGCAAKFRLNIFYEPTETPILVKPVEEWPQVCEIRGSWTPNLSGGCSNNKETWRNNPCFALRINSSNNGSGFVALKLASIETSQNLDNAPQVGIYILGDGEMVPNGKIITVTPKFSQHALLKYSLPETKSRPFIVLCATFQPRYCGDFVLTAFSTSNIELTNL